MKTLLLLIAAGAAFAAEPVVKISISVENQKTVEATVSPEAVAAINAFLAEQKKEDGTPKYAGISDLFIRHTRDSLTEPLVRRYSEQVRTAQAAAEAAQKAANDAAAAVAAGTVVVK